MLYTTSYGSLTVSVGCWRYVQGVAKKRSPHQKWVAWFIKAINKENVNKRYVFTCIGTCVQVHAIIATHSELFE